MNKVLLFGRLVKDVDVRYTDNGKIIGSLTIAVDRPKLKGQEKAEADFILCKAFGQKAEVIGNYFSKGSRILVEGTIRTGSYEKNGQKVYTTEVWVNDFRFVDKRSSNNSYTPKASQDDDFDVPF